MSIAGKRVMVADDDRSVTELLRRVLMKAGCDVSVVGDGEEALARLAEGQVDLLFVDRNMPRLSGHEVARRVRTLYPDIAVAMITALDEPLDEEDARWLDHWVAKPVRHLVEIEEAAELALQVRALARGRAT